MILQNWWYTTLLGLADPIQPPLRGKIETDVLIIGAGAAGLAAALGLIDSGKRVVILERNICGGSSTGKSAGFLTPDSELELSQLIRRFGKDGARDLWEVPVKGIETMLSVIKENGIQCDLVKQDSMLLGKGAGGWKSVQDEAESRKKLGYPYSLYSKDMLSNVVGTTKYSGGIRYPGTYGIDGLRYAQGVKRMLLANGIQIFESSKVSRVEGHTAYTHMGSVTADQIIFCADKLTPELSKYSWNVYHEQTFLSISEPLSDIDIKLLFPDEPLQCWDTDLIYTYFRLTGTKRLLVGGGSILSTYAKNDTTNTRIVQHLHRKLKQQLPCIKNIGFIQYWSGRIDMTRDLLPTVLRNPDAPWIHYVLGCVGLPWATFCGDFVARQILGKGLSGEEKYYSYFRADRKFLVPLWLERIIGKRIVFLLNNAWAKYYQVDKNELIQSRDPPP